MSVYVAKDESSSSAYSKDHAGQNHGGQGVSVMMIMMMVVISVNTRSGKVNLALVLFNALIVFKTMLGSGIKINTGT
jgi:hypothetical protein